MHKTPLTDLEREGLIAHGLESKIGRPSQLVDSFRLGVAWALNQSLPATETAGAQDWKSVPTTPTPEMIRAGNRVTWPFPCQPAYEVMIAAAPEHIPNTAQAPSEPKGELSLEQLLRAAVGWSANYPKHDLDAFQESAEGKIAQLMSFYKHPVQERTPEWNEKQLQMLNFLYGSGEFDGVWFEESHPKEKGKFWWRKHLRNLFDAPPKTEQIQDREASANSPWPEKLKEGVHTINGQKWLIQRLATDEEFNSDKNA